MTKRGPIIHDDAIMHLAPEALRPWPRNARTHSKKQIGQIADSIRTFGFTNPVLIDEEKMILAGHGRVAAARLLGLETVPCRLISSIRPPVPSSDHPTCGLALLPVCAMLFRVSPDRFLRVLALGQPLEALGQTA